jgi:hypothetical protein
MFANSNCTKQLHHSVRKDEINPVISMNKEDAEFAFMVLLAITQLLQKKFAILKDTVNSTGKTATSPSYL